MTDPFFRSGVAGLDRVSVDAGLRAHMQRVFAYMAGGLVLTGLLAWIASLPAFAGILIGSPLRWVFVIAPFGFLMFMNYRINTIGIGALRALFWAFCGTMGLSLGSIFLAYSDASIARAFFITAGTFGGMALWGYTTKKDLSNFGAFLMMGVLGLLIASVVNLFMHSAPMQWVVCVLGVFIFTGLTAWTVQSIKQTYAEFYGEEANEKLALFGALSLYINFINAFTFLLQLVGDRR